MKPGDLVRCWWSDPNYPPFPPFPPTVVTGILMDVIDAPDEVSVYIPSMKNVYWFPKGDYEVISASR